MTLRNKLALAMSMVFLFYLGLIYASLKMFVTPSFERLEMFEAKQDLQRGVEAVEHVAYDIGLFVRDWSEWDASYDFMKNQDPGYLKSNITDSVFYDNALNFIYYLNLQGEVKWGRVVDLVNEEPYKMPEEVVQQIRQAGKDTLDLEVGQEGILVTDQGSIFISIEPITKSDGESDVVGALVMGRFMTEDVIAQISQHVRIQMQVEPAWRHSMEDSVSGRLQLDSLVKKTLETGKNFLVQETGQSLRLFTTIPNLKFRPILLLDVTVGREIVSQGRIAMWITFFATLMVGPLSLVLLMVIVRIIQIHE